MKLIEKVGSWVVERLDHKVLWTWIIINLIILCTIILYLASIGLDTVLAGKEIIS